MAPSLLPKSPHHLLLRRGNYYFRFVIPARLRPVVGKTEIKYSLDTNDLRLARRRSAHLGAGVVNIMNALDAQTRGGDPVDYSKAELLSLIDDHYQHIMSVNETSLAVEQKPKGNGLENLQAGSEIFKSMLTDGNFAEIATELVDSFLSSKGISIDESCEEYKVLKRGFLINYCKLMRTNLQYVQDGGDLDDIERNFRKYVLDEPGAPIADHQRATQVQPTVQKQALDTVWDAFISFKVNDDKRITDITKSEYKTAFSLFKEIVSKEFIEDIGRSEISKYRSTWIKIPKFRAARYKGKTIDELVNLDLPPEECLSQKSKGKHFGFINAFFRYAEDNGFINANPCGKILAIHSSPREESAANLPYTPSELIKIFNAEGYIQDSFDSSFMFWGPIISLYSGARINEIAQLYTEDVKVIDSIACIHICKGRTKNLKTTLLFVTYRYIQP